MVKPRRLGIKLAGFTLIELLVAISILAIIAVLGWRGLDGIMRARMALTQNMEQSRGMQLSFAQLQADCSQIVRPRDIANRTALAAEPGRLTLVRTVFADNQPLLLKVVAYRIKDGVLTRRESAVTRDLHDLDLYWHAQLGDIDTSQAVALQTGIADMTLRIWVENGTGWQTPESLPAPVAPAALPPPAAVGAANPVSVNPPVDPTNNAGTPIGLEVALKIREQHAVVTKVFLLGVV